MLSKATFELWFKSNADPKISDQLLLYSTRYRIDTIHGFNWISWSKILFPDFQFMMTWFRLLIKHINLVWERPCTWMSTSNHRVAQKISLFLIQEKGSNYINYIVISFIHQIIYGITLYNIMLRDAFRQSNAQLIRKL